MLPLRVTCLLEHGSNLREYPSVSLATCECIFSQLVVYFFSQADGCASLENSLKITEISPAAVVAFALFVFHARLHESPLCRSAGKVQVILRRTSVCVWGGPLHRSSHCSLAVRLPVSKRARGAVML